MYPQTILLLLANLQKDLRKALHSDELKKSFDSIFSQTYSLQPPSELLKGLTPERKLAVLKTSLENFENEHHLGLYNDWVKSTFKFCDQLIKEQRSNKECKMSPQNSDVSKKSTSEKENSASSSKSPVGPKSTADKKVKLPSASKRVKIYDGLLKLGNSGSQLLKGKHITCTDSQCSFCKSLFMNIPLTKCNHKACTPGGWYPHVGERLWKALQKHHKPGNFFLPKETGTKDGQLPSIIQAKVEAARSEVSPSAMDHSSCAEMSDTQTVVSTSYTPSIRSSKSRSPPYEVKRKVAGAKIHKSWGSEVSLELRHSK